MAQPWDRKAKEGEEAYAAFLAYRDMGEARSLDAVGRELVKSVSLLSRWSARHKWVGRCTAWDNHLQRERNKVAAREAARWEARRQQALEATWQAAQVLREKAGRMLAFPLQTTRSEDDGRTMIVEPARWTFQAVAMILKTAVELEAAALLAVGKDPAEMDDEEAGAIAEAGRGLS